MADVSRSELVPDSGSHSINDIGQRVHRGMEKPRFIEGLRVDTSELPDWYGIDFTDKSLLMAVFPSTLGGFWKNRSPRIGNLTAAASQSPVVVSKVRRIKFTTVISRVFSALSSFARFPALFQTNGKPVVPLQ
jgi:hypothetical protein